MLSGLLRLPSLRSRNVKIHNFVEHSSGGRRLDNIEEVAVVTGPVLFILSYYVE